MPVDRERLAADRDALLARLAPRLRAGGGEWLETSRKKIPVDPAALAPAFAAAGRKAGRGPLVDPRPDAAVRLHGVEGPVLDPWTVDDAARVVLLLEDALRDADGVERRAKDLYEHGELRERIAVLRALQLLPVAEDGIRIVRDALRANARDLFAAAICENLFASTKLPDEIFFQAVLKSVFVELPLGRIERLRERTTPELSRMLYAYVTERDAAGRPVPEDVWPVISLHPPPGSGERIARAVAASGRSAG